MVKRHVNVSVEDELMLKAKDKGINVSGITEQAIRDKLGYVETMIDTSVTNCEFCGKEDRQATRDDLMGLTWLFPDERWICDSCLKRQGKAKNTRTVKI